MKIRPRGATGGCCPDCMDRHKLSCGCGCIPEWLCVIAEFTSEECCRYATVNLYHECNSDDYSQGQLVCGEAGLIVTASVTKTEVGCCFTVTLSNSLETLTFLKYGDDFEVGFEDGEIEFEIQVNENYPPRFASGTLTVNGLGGVTNKGQFGDLETGECPPCGLIRLNPRAIFPDLPVKLNADEACDRSILSVATKTAERVFGPIDGRDPDLFEDEFCWFVAPCHCIPDNVCVNYTALTVCEGLKIIRRKLTLKDCVYGPASFTVDRGGPYGADTITIEGILGDDCNITWKVTSTDYGEVEIERGLSRILLNSPPKIYSKRCDLTLDETTVTGFETDGVEDTIQVTEDCLCLESTDKICPSACEVARMPPGANPDCYLVVLTATVMSGCEFGEFSFEMHASTYEQPQSVLQDHLIITEPACQIYHGYNSDLRNFYLPPQSCTTIQGVDPYPTTDMNDLIQRFTLYYPSSCSIDDDPTLNPYNYVLRYELENFCGFTINVESGSVTPVSASCTPFELVFEVPNNPACYCGNCSTLTVKVTL